GRGDRRAVAGRERDRARFRSRNLDLGAYLQGKRDGLFGKLSYHARSIRPRRNLGHDLLDLALRLVDGSREQSVPVLSRENRRQLADAAQVEPAVRQHLEEDWVLPSGLGDREPELGLALGEVKDVRAVREHRRDGVASVEVSGFHLADVGDERGLDTARLPEEIGEAGEQLVVGE